MSPFATGVQPPLLQFGYCDTSASVAPLLIVVWPVYELTLPSASVPEPETINWPPVLPLMPPSAMMPSNSLPL